jgi:dienelactone hydrolase
MQNAGRVLDFADTWLVEAGTRRDGVCPTPAMLAGEAGSAARTITAVAGRRNLVWDLHPGTGRCAVGDEAWVWIRVAAPTAGRYRIGIAADWWFAAWLDGRPLLDTLELGNAGPIACERHQTEAELAAGGHVLLVRVIAGAGGWTLAVGTPGGPAAQTAPPADHARWLAAAPPVPVFAVPDDPRGLSADQQRIRATAWSRLGFEPDQPSAPLVEPLGTVLHDGYAVERFRFAGTAGWSVPGVVYRPLTPGPHPGVLWCHWHGGDHPLGLAALATDACTPEAPGPALARRGYVVLGVEAPCFGQLHGHGPDGTLASEGESSLAKYELLFGRSMWGLIVAHDRMALSILAARPDVDAACLGAAGISMGCLRALWLAALDERVRATVAVCCLVRLQDLIGAGGLRWHGHYYYVPGLLRDFDLEALVACIAPRALLSMNGAIDPLTPRAGIGMIDRLARPAWELHRAGDRLRIEIHDDVGHAWTVPMWQEGLAWFERHLGSAASGADSGAGR